MEDVDQIQVSIALEYKVFSICYARYLTQIDIYCYWKTFNAWIEYSIQLPSTFSTIPVE